MKIGNSRKFVKTFSLLFLASALFLKGINYSASAEENSSPVGFTSLQNCMDGKNASLNVVYLMDISKSMEKSDPKNARSDMIKSSLRLFYQVSKDTKKPFNYTFVSFGSTGDTGVTTPWTALNSGNITSQAQAAKISATRNDSRGTDWRQGLRIAKEQIQAKAADPNSCFVLSWMTDGQIDLNTVGVSWVPQDSAAYKDICSESDGLINWFRDPARNIATIGALLSKNAKLNGSAFDSLSLEEQSVRLFRPVIEGNGEVPQKVGSKYGLAYSFGSYQCGRVTPLSNVGKLVTSGKAEDLSWQFLDLIAHLRGLSKADLDSSGGVSIDNSVGRIEVFTKGKKSGNSLQVTDSNGTDVCAMAGKCTRTKEENWTNWLVNIPSSGVSPGDWIIKTNSTEAPKVFLGSHGDPKNITIAFRPMPQLKNIVEGSSVTTTAVLVHEDGTEVDATEFSDVCLQLDSPQVDENSSCKPSLTSIPIQFKAATTNKILKVTAKYHFTGSRDDAQISRQEAMHVKSNDAFAKLTCENYVSDACLLESIPNSKQPSVTDLKASVKQGFSTITLTKFTADDSVERVNSYVPSPLQEIITVRPGQSQTIKFTLSNSKTKNPVSDIRGILTYEVSDSSGQTVTAQLPVIFSINHKENILVLIGCYLLALLVGVGLPYLLLLRQTRRSAVFVTNTFRFVTFPVRLTPPGRLVSTNSTDVTALSSSAVENSLASSRVGEFFLPAEDLLSGYKSVPENSKHVDIGSASLNVRKVGFNAFAPISVDLHVSESLVFSSQGDKRYLLLDSHTSAELSLTDLYFFTASMDELDPVAVNSIKTASTSDFDQSEDGYQTVTTQGIREDGISGFLTLVVAGDSAIASSILNSFRNQIQSQDFSPVLEQLRTLRVAKLEEAQKAENEALKNAAKPNGSSNSNSKPPIDFGRETGGFDEDEIDFGKNPGKSVDFDDDF